MQSRRWQHGSSAGELGVFRATRYFVGQAHHQSADADRLTAASMAEISFRGHVDEQLVGVHDDLRRAPELAVEPANKPKPAGNKSKLAAFLGFMVSPSPGGTSFLKKSATPISRSTTAAAAGEEPTMKVISLSSATTSSRESTDDDDLVVASSGASNVQLKDGCGLVDLGVATGDRRLQGVKVVRGTEGDEERWVVRCSAPPRWEDQDEPQHRQAAMFCNAASSRIDDYPHHQVEHDWESDSSSDLFDLDIGEYVDL